jgi:DNA replication and repair protein RecF
MKLEKIRLTNFRNFKSKLVKFSPETTVIVGPNASGKTNILEALYLLSTGKSFRARVEEEMIRHRDEIARVKGLVVDSELGSEGKDKFDLEVVLTRGEITIGEDPVKKEKSQRKKLLVNGVGRRLFNFAGNFKVVMFGPWDLDLVTESPSRRRKFLDFVLSQVDKEYYRASLSYEKGLRQRNRLLFRIREEGLSRSQLVFWDRLLIKNGDYISEKREEFINFVDSTKDFPASVINKKRGVEDYSIEYDKSAISEARLEQYKSEEVASATTLVGPHRDDFCIRLKKNKRARDLARFGSRGEQRMGVLWLKLAELAFVENETNEQPTLLLDDIFSELDHEHRDVVMSFIRGQQTIITTADPHFIESLKKVEKIEL